jgi:hypothetical protein
LTLSPSLRSGGFLISLITPRKKTENNHEYL